MGARSSSPRTVRLDNESPASVIDVSEDVVYRLKGMHSKDIEQQREHDRRVAAAAVAAARLEWEKELQHQQKQQQQPSSPKQPIAQVIPVVPVQTVIQSGKFLEIE